MLLMLLLLLLMMMTMMMLFGLQCQVLEKEGLMKDDQWLSQYQRRYQRRYRYCFRVMGTGEEALLACL